MRAYGLGLGCGGLGFRVYDEDLWFRLIYTATNSVVVRRGESHVKDSGMLNANWGYAYTGVYRDIYVCESSSKR